MSQQIKKKELEIDKLNNHLKVEQMQLTQVSDKISDALSSLHQKPQ